MIKFSTSIGSKRPPSDAIIVKLWLSMENWSGQYRKPAFIILNRYLNPCFTENVALGVAWILPILSVNVFTDPFPFIKIEVGLLLPSLWWWMENFEMAVSLIQSFTIIICSSRSKSYWPITGFLLSYERIINGPKAPSARWRPEWVCQK